MSGAGRTSDVSPDDTMLTNNRGLNNNQLTSIASDIGKLTVLKDL